MANFWNESNQTRIPFVQKFNEAVKGSEKVVWLLGTLSFGWASAGLVWAALLGGVIAEGSVNGLWGFPVGLRVMYMAQNGGL